jgi:hypothetical protein
LRPHDAFDDVMPMPGMSLSWMPTVRAGAPLGLPAIERE